MNFVWVFGRNFKESALKSMKFKKHEHEVGVLVYHYILQYVSAVTVMFYSLVKGCIATQIPCLAQRMDFCPHFCVMPFESEGFLAIF
jgi:hypothetical protein